MKTLPPNSIAARRGVGGGAFSRTSLVFVRETGLPPDGEIKIPRGVKLIDLKAGECSTKKQKPHLTKKDIRKFTSECVWNATEAAFKSE